MARKHVEDTFAFPKELGQRLRNLRLKAGLNQRLLAEQMGRRGQGRDVVVSRLEQGKQGKPGQRGC